jgi:hypothetical protein
MKEALKSIGSGIGGIIILCFILMIPAFFILGGVKLSKFIIPWLMSISGIVFIINVLIFLPHAIFKKTRGFSGLAVQFILCHTGKPMGITEKIKYHAVQTKESYSYAQKINFNNSPFDILINNFTSICWC